MCDECLRLGVPWLPGLHGGKPRPRPKIKRQSAKPTAATQRGKKPRG